MLTDLESVVELYGLCPLTLDQRLYFQNVFANLKNPTTDYSFVYLYPYAHLLKLSWRTIHKHLCIFMVEDNLLHMALPPIPEADAGHADTKNSLLECFRIMNHHNHDQGNTFGGVIHTISEEIVERIKLCEIPGIAIKPSFVSGDYIYDMQKMITLSGASLGSKRNARNKFIKHHPNARTEPFSSADIPACIELLETWEDDKQTKDPDFSYDKNEIMRRNIETAGCKKALHEWQDLKLTGMTLYTEDKLIGFTFGEALTPSQASIVFEKTHPDYDGSSAYIFAEFCRQYWWEYKECNAGDDASSQSIRFTKDLYRPIRLLNKSIISQDV